MKPLRILGLVAIIILGVATSALAFSWYVQRRAYENSYSQINVGDSKQKLISIYGQPSETTDCSNYKRPSYIDALRKDCVEVYWYRSLLEQWIFFLDKDGKIVHKAFNAQY